MASKYDNITFWSGSGGDISGSTPYGFYDGDTEFQSEGPKFATWAAQKLGYPVVQIELPSGIWSKYLNSQIVFLNDINVFLFYFFYKNVGLFFF